MITVSYRGSFSKTEKSLTFLKGKAIFDDFDHYGKMGVDILSKATPRDTGETAQSWTYEVDRTPGKASITWKNTHRVNGVNIAIIIQYGHGTGTGGYVAGIDYINPAMQPFMNQVLDEFWKKVTNV